MAYISQHVIMMCTISGSRRCGVWFTDISASTEKETDCDMCRVFYRYDYYLLHHYVYCYVLNLTLRKLAHVIY